MTTNSLDNWLPPEMGYSGEKMLWPETSKHLSYLISSSQLLQVILKTYSLRCQSLPACRFTCNTQMFHPQSYERTISVRQNRPIWRIEALWLCNLQQRGNLSSKVAHMPSCIKRIMEWAWHMNLRKEIWGWGRGREEMEWGDVVTPKEKASSSHWLCITIIRVAKHPTCTGDCLPNVSQGPKVGFLGLMSVFPEQSVGDLILEVGLQ